MIRRSNLTQRGPFGGPVCVSAKELRGRAESAYRTGHGPKFFCCHCGKNGKSLRHLAICGRKRVP
jgi:hypothetical protein